VKRVWPAAGATAAAALGVYAGWIEPRRLVVRRLELRLPHWPATLDGLRAGVLTDLHAGVPHARLPAIQRAVAALNAAEPDVHLLLGDYLDASQILRRDIAPQTVADALARLRSPLGTFAVLGNHDWRAAGYDMWHALVRAGIDVLEDRAVRLHSSAGAFWLAGLGDLRYRGANVQRALADVPPGEPVVVLAHDPDLFPHVPGRVSLTLSGHTHGGQVAIPALRRPLLPSAYGERYARGLVVEHGRHLLVSSGIGTSGLPVRLFAPPEVLVLTLRPG
jgi:predicted MPP superfamily phosphohydrolase